MLIWNILFYLGIFGTGLMSVGLISEIINPNEDIQIAPGITALLIFGIIPLFLGFYKKRQLKKLLLVNKKTGRFNSLLKLAKIKNGILSISEVSLELEISIDEARDVLEEAVTKGICTVEIDDNGNLDYIFRDLISN